VPAQYLAALSSHKWLIVYHGIYIAGGGIDYLPLPNRPRFFAIILILILILLSLLLLLLILLIFILLLCIFLLFIVTVPFHIHITVEINVIRLGHIMLPADSHMKMMFGVRFAI
jgi:hypothetical protein